MSLPYDLDLDDIRKQLLARKETLENVSDQSSDIRNPVELDQTRQGRLSRMDALQQQAMSKETERRRQLEIKKIESALQRIDEGDYGYCVISGEPIEYERLMADLAVPTSRVALEERE